MKTHLEKLEQRQMLSAASLRGGVLRVSGDLGHANTIVVALSDDGLTVNVTVDSTLKNGNKNVTKSFSAADIQRVDIFGGRKADEITVSQGLTPFNIRTRIFARAGNDTINTADGADLIRGHHGNDTINSGGGDDLVIGAHGHDDVDAGAGNDIIRGGHGNDELHGGDGDDRVMGGKGADKLFGDAGDDVLGAVWGNNEAEGGLGNDTFLVRTINQNVLSDFTDAEDIVRSARSEPASV